MECFWFYDVSKGTQHPKICLSSLYIHLSIHFFDSWLQINCLQEQQSASLQWEWAELNVIWANLAAWFPFFYNIHIKVSDFLCVFQVLSFLEVIKVMFKQLLLFTRIIRKQHDGLQIELFNFQQTLHFLMGLLWHGQKKGVEKPWCWTSSIGQTSSTCVHRPLTQYSVKLMPKEHFMADWLYIRLPCVFWKWPLSRHSSTYLFFCSLMFLGKSQKTWATRSREGKQGWNISEPSSRLLKQGSPSERIKQAHTH